MYICKRIALPTTFLVVCFLFSSLYYADAAELTLDNIVKGIRFHASLIKSGKGRYTLEYSTTELGAEKKKQAQEGGVIITPRNWTVV
jgi:hypothetical protein